MYQPKPPKRKKRDKYTKFARGRACTLRFPVCSNNTETSVLAHLNGAGQGTKAQNIHGAIACFECHRVLDGEEDLRSWSAQDIQYRFYEAVIETQIEMIKHGVLEL